MAQTNYTPIQLYYSATPSSQPLSSNLVNGELALNITDGKLYYKDNTGTVQLLAQRGGFGVSSFNTRTGAVTLQQSDISTALSVSNAPANGQLLIGNGTGYSLATLTAGANVTITNSAGGITIAATGGGSGAGTVTSVNVSGGTTGLTFTGGPVTTSGTITAAGTLGIANGGTGVTGTPTNGQLLIGNGTGYGLATLTAGANVTITNSAGGITIAATGGGGGGSVTAVNDTTTNSSLYPLFAAATSGTISTVYTSNPNYNYNPSTGALSANELVATNGLIINATTVSSSFTVATGQNVLSVGPITTASGATVTIPSGQRWVIL